MLPAQPNQSLIDGLTCLHAVIAAGTGLGSRELSRHVGLERTRANRLLGTWRHLGLLDQLPSAKYVPGPGIHVLAGMGMKASGLLQAALAPVKAFWEDGWAVSLGVRWQDRLCFLIHARPDQAFEAGIGSHATAAAVHSSAGLALLATASDAELATWNCAELWQTLGDGREFAAVINDVRECGYATRTYPTGMRSVGVAIPGSQAALALSRPGLVARGTVAVARTCHEAAAAISADMVTNAAAWRDHDSEALPA
jgi:DNA-binding IclR family transcriptional regulator